MARTGSRRTGTQLCLLVAVLIAFTTACASRGNPFDADNIASIEIGQSTSEDIRELFGNPVGVEVWGHGGAEWNYLHEEVTRRDTGMFARIVRAIASFFVRPLFFPPVNVEYKNEITHDLTVYFDSDGVVSNYKYEKTEVPSKRVY